MEKQPSPGITTISPIIWRVSRRYTATMNGEYTLTFAIIDPETQSRRILLRNGEAMHRRFIAEWIPMEEHYFSAFKIRERCDMVFCM